MQPKIKLLSLAALIASAASPALAQDAADAADRLDSRLTRLDQTAESAPDAQFALDGAAQPFTFSATLPFTYNSNIDRAGDDGKGSFHATPSVRLDWAQSIGGNLTLSARVHADADTYLGEDGYDGSTLLGRVGIKMAVSPRFTPYIHYTPALVYSGLYDDHLQTLNSFTGGFETSFELDPTTKLTLDFNAARRESSVETSEQNRFGASARLEGKFNGRLSWTLSQVVQKRHYTGGLNDGRDDWNMVSVGQVSWTLSPQFTLSGVIAFEHNSSDRDGKDYSFVDIGPSIRLAQKF